MSMFSRDDLERLKHETSEPGPRLGGRNALVDQILPLESVAARKPAIYDINDPNPVEPEPEAPAKTEPVTAPVPVKKKKVIITDMNTGIRKIEYR